MIYHLLFKRNRQSSTPIQSGSIVNRQSHSGFTLIELLIVIAIIGILSAILMANLVGVRQRARDAQRKSDLRQIQSALELYRSDQGSYPLTASFPTCGSLFAGGSPSVTYMQKIPCDPSGSTYWYAGNYYYASSDNITYSLGACVENSNDSSPQITSTSPSGSSINCTSGKYYVLTQP